MSEHITRRMRQQIPAWQSFQKCFHVLSRGRRESTQMFQHFVVRIDVLLNYAGTAAQALLK